MLQAGKRMNAPSDDARVGVSRAERLDLFIAASVAIATVALLALPVLRVDGGGPWVSGATLIRDRQELCFDCAEDAPYPMLLWLELIAALAGLVAGLGWCFRGGGWQAIARTVLLVASAIVLLWAPFQTDASDRPTGIVPVFVGMGVAFVVVGTLAAKGSRSNWWLVTRAIALGVAGIALLMVVGTRRQMPFTYDRLLWGFFLAVFATAVAIVAAIAVAVASSTEQG